MGVLDKTPGGSRPGAARKQNALERSNASNVQENHCASKTSRSVSFCSCLHAGLICDPVQSSPPSFLEDTAHDWHGASTMR
eukprot:4179218-Pyramimonas_sp.AAC.2